MRTRAVLGSIFASLAVIVIGWQAGSAALTASTTPSPTTTGTTGTSTTPNTSTGGSSSSGSSGSSGASGGTSSGTSTNSGTSTGAQTPASGAADGTYTGTSVNTRFGTVQVSVTVSGGSIANVTPLHLTDADGRSVQISNRAAPLLRQEVLASQSAHVAGVSGATYTSDAYLTSLQAALDQAGL